MDVYNNPLALARVDELLRLNKTALVAKARNPLPHIHSHGALERWRKQELAWSIVRAEFELDDGPHEP